MTTATKQARRALRRARDGDPPQGPSGAGIDPIRLGRSLAYSGYTVLLCRDDGGIGHNEGGIGGDDGGISGDDDGLWDLDTRVLSRYDLRLDGRRPRPIGSCVADGATWAATLIQTRAGDAEGPRLPQDAWEVRIQRRIGCGMAERIEVLNRSMARASVELAIELDADFIDRLEPRDHGAERSVTSAWIPERHVLRFDAATRFEGREDRRGTAIAVSDPPDDVAEPGGEAANARVLCFVIDLPAGGSRRVDLTYATHANGTWRQPIEAAGRADTADAWRAIRTHVRTGDALVGPAVERAAEDLLDLRQWELSADLPSDAWVVNAGVPRFTGFFGRDCLTAGWQASMLGPEAARGAIELAAATQGTKTVLATEEQPGRMIHEMRSGPLASLGVVPHGRYYGTQTTGSMFVLALSEAWHWTGDTDLLRRHRDAALKAIYWAETLADVDGDGFMEYDSHTPGGLKNQGWKDSNEAIRYPDGRIVDNPISTVEEQAFHFIALERMAEILVALGDEVDAGDPDRAEALLRRAAFLRTAWDAAFWLPRQGFYALALDGEHRPVATIASNPGHALGTGIVPRERARDVADRLLSPDLFSGWGVRTLSASHPSFNPLAYHLGAVWPVENATIALGFKRYGLDDHLDQLVEGLFTAIAHCRDLRLPEALSGHDRADVPHPLPYPRSQSPQAWSASATIQLLQTMLGIYPFAPAHVLGLVRPRLPVWLPVVTLEGLRVGDATVTLRFERGDDGTAHHAVLAQDGPLWVLEVPPPDAVAGGDGVMPRLLAWAVEHAPGRTATALRIALGENGTLHDGGTPPDNGYHGGEPP